MGSGKTTLARSIIKNLLPDDLKNLKDEERERTIRKYID